MKKMSKYLNITLILFALSLKGHAITTFKNDSPPTDPIKIYSLNPEKKTSGGTTTEFLMQIQNKNNTKLLVILACSKCTPAVYTYQQDLSLQYKTDIYFNSMGIYVIKYDNDSYVSIMPDKALGKGAWNNFFYTNYYTSNKSNISSITTKNIEDYATSLSKKP